MQKEPVIFPLKSVPHLVGEDALKTSAGYFSGYEKVFALVDENTEKYCLPVFYEMLPSVKVTGIVRIKSGEINKNITTASSIWQQLTTFHAERNSLLINLGGGVITDIGGFTAATFKRGMDFINIPTTVLCQVDAAIGSKTGIDFDEYKNQVGLFAEPKAVIVDPVFLKTLDERQYRSGFAEILKYALIMDVPLWQMMNRKAFAGMQEDMSELMIKSVADKISIVEKDMHESGLRKLLNFGHTVGHALETFLLKAGRPVTHGEAVAAGMICATAISAGLSDFDCHLQEQIYQTIDQNFPRLDFSENDIPKIMQLMQQDKKTKQNKLHFTLLPSLGKAVQDIVIPKTTVEESLQFYLRNK